MTQTRSLCYLAGVAWVAFAISAHAQQTARPLTGTWRGRYVCAQGPTGLTLTIDRQSGPDFSGTFHFYPPRGNPNAREGCFAVKGRVEADRSVTVEAGEWMTRPPGYITVDLHGMLGQSGLSMTGDVVTPPQLGPLCKRFELNWHGARTAIDSICRGAGLQVLRDVTVPAAVAPQ